MSFHPPRVALTCAGRTDSLRPDDGVRRGGAAALPVERLADARQMTRAELRSRQRHKFALHMHL